MFQPTSNVYNIQFIQNFFHIYIKKYGINKRSLSKSVCRVKICWNIVLSFNKNVLFEKIFKKETNYKIIKILFHNLNKLFKSYTLHLWGFKYYIKLYFDILYVYKLNINLNIIIQFVLFYLFISRSFIWNKSS